MKQILRSILKHCQIESPEILHRIKTYFDFTEWIASDHFEELQTKRNNVVFERSISFLFPDLAKQWHPTKNGPLLPEHFTPGSHKVVWWQNHLGQEWKAEICYRVNNERNRIDPDQLTLFGGHE